MKMEKSFQLQRGFVPLTPPGALPLDPRGALDPKGCGPRPPFRLAARVPRTRHGPPASWQILDPPLLDCNDHIGHVVDSKTSQTIKRACSSYFKEFLFIWPFNVKLQSIGCHAASFRWSECLVLQTKQARTVHMKCIPRFTQGHVVNTTATAFYGTLF